MTNKTQLNEIDALRDALAGIEAMASFNLSAGHMREEIQRIADECRERINEGETKA